MHHSKFQIYSALKIILPLVTLLIVALILVGFYLNNLFKTQPTVAEESWPVAYQAIQKGAHSPVVTLFGKVESFQATKIEAAITADVNKVLVKEGSEVKTGQLLIQLDDREAKITLKENQAQIDQIKAEIAQEKIKYRADKQSVLQQQSRVALQKKEVARLDKLFRQKHSSESLLDQARSLLNEQELRLTENKLKVENYDNVIQQKRSQLLRADANLDAAKLDLERTRIYAPYDGRVTRLNIAVGNRVQPSEVLLELFPNENIEVRAQIPSIHLGAIQQALKNKIPLMAKARLDDETYTFSLARIAANIAAGQAGLDAIFVLEEKNKFIAQNRIITLYLKLPKFQNSIVIPETALYEGDTVYLIQGNRLKSVKVKVAGLFFDKDNRPFRLIVSQQIPDNAKLLTTHLLNARDGLKVTLK